MRWYGRAVLAAIGLGLAALTLEIGLRVLYPDVRIIARDQRVGSLARPNLDVRKTFGGHERVVRITTNALGLRGPAVPDAPAPGVRRVIALGDSFTFGAAVEAEEAWPARLEARLDRGRFTRWQVVNAGIPGHGTGQQLLLYRMLAERFRPDAVVLGLTVVNDILDNLCVEESTYTPKAGAPCFVLDGDRLHLVAPAKTAEAPPARASRLRVADFVVGQARRLTLGHPRLLALAERSGIATELPYVPATVASWYDPRYVEPGWRLTQRLLLELRRELASRRIPLVVLIIPAALQADPNLQSAVRTLGHRHAAVQAFADEPDKPQRLVTEFCRAAALECVDALPGVRDLERRGVRTYYAIDNHWTPAAHALAADLVAQRLGDRALASAP